MLILSTIGSTLSAVKDRVVGVFYSPAAQQVEAQIAPALDSALEAFLAAELTALGVASPTAADIPTLLGRLTSAIVAALAAKLTALVTSSTPASNTPASK